MKVATILGTRPEIIKMSRVMAVCDKVFDHKIIHTGQNFDAELSDVFFDDLGIRAPDHYLGAAGATPVDTIAQVLCKVDQVLEDINPEAVLIYGDTNSGLSCIAAKRRRIPIFHFEAGNRCFDARVPEEINRRIIDHTSDVNITLTEHARRYLLAEGIPAERVFKFGSHMPEVLEHAEPGIRRSDILERLDLKGRRFIVVSAHREENVDVPVRLHALVQAVSALSQRLDAVAVVSTHPRTRRRIAEQDLALPDNVVFHRPFGFLDYVRLQTEALCVVSDSGTIAEEASLLGFPAVSLRDAHERPEAVDAGALTLSSLSDGDLISAVELTIASHNAEQTGRGALVPDYASPGSVSQKAVRLIQGYAGYVGRTVWRSNPSLIP